VALLSVLAVVAASAVLSACGSSSTESDAATSATGGTSTATETAAVAPASADACKGKSLNFIGLAGEEGEKELKDWRAAQDMQLMVNNNADWGQVIGAIKVGQTFDLSTMPVLEGPRMIKAGIVQPIDTSKLKNWDAVVPALRESPAIRGEDGQVYGVPILWGDGPYVYAPDRVSNPPTSIMELLKPEWKGRYTMFDDPGLPFFMIASAMGFDPPNLTKEQFDQVKPKVQELVDNAAAFQTSYQDASDRMVSGDVDLAIGGWEAMLGFAKAKGATLDFKFFDESEGGGYFDAIAIPKTAENPDCALAYIDQLISPKANAALATNLTSGAANADSEPLLGKAAQVYNYDLVSKPTGGIDFVAYYPPEQAKDGYASLKDWQDAWAEIKAR
jgi:spermidine/putrescine-binding protein